MPGWALDAPFEAHQVDVSSLRSHKALPGSAKLQRAQQSFSGPADNLILSNRAQNLANQIVAHNTTAPSVELPPTPPTGLHESERGRANVGHLLRQDWGMGAPGPVGPGVSTPIFQRSPPTPDITPPASKLKYTTSSIASSQRLPSSCAESFKTALEDQLSSDEGGLAASYHSSISLKNDGQGGDGDARSPSVVLRRRPDLAREGETAPIVYPGGDEVEAFRAFDGSWGRVVDNEMTATAREWNGNNSRNARSKNLHDPFIEANPTSKAECQTTRRKPKQQSLDHRKLSDLRCRIKHKRDSIDRNSTERAAEQISWTAFDLHTVVPTPLDMVSRRLSAMSSASTVVEAIVFEEVVPQRRRTLRHCGRNSSLRELSSSQARIVSLPTPQKEVQHRLVRSGAPLPERKRAISATDLTFNPQSRERQYVAARDRPSGEPIAYNDSYLTSAVSSMLGNESIQTTPTYLPPRGLQRHRPLGVLDPAHRDDQTAPDWTQLAMTRESARSDDGLVVLPRSSSLSAPTSRNASRTASLSSGSVIVAQRERVGEDADRGAEAITERDMHQVHYTHGDAPTYLTAPTMSLSQTSNVSTPEALEVSQATAVNIYPHNNDSLLIVQQHSRPQSRDHEAVTGATILSPTPPTISLPIQRVDGSPGEPLSLLDPPALQIIPPTPHPVTPDEEGEEQGDEVASNARGKRTSLLRTPSGRALTIVKRALGNNKYSDGFVSPFQRSNSQKQQRRQQQQPSSSSSEENSKLYPFWRPRGFWNDLEVDDEDIKEEILERGRSELLESIASQDRRMSLPIMDNARYLDGSSRLKRQDSLPARPGQGQRGTQQRGSSAHAGIGLRLNSMGWKKLQRRIREARRGRAEKIRTWDREEIKKSISTPVGVDPWLH
ncbi:MAG: hypothetical protein M1825_003407 [Sarcosagium campestre]|nr:MAG: hypothetical protein M1825_003407 [Sarcosagium campestre]